MTQRPTDRDVVRELRVRLPLPVLIPVAALLFIALCTIGLSRILLAVPTEAAVVIALAMALNLLGAAAYLAAKPNPERGSIMELLMVVLYPVIIGIVLTQINFTTAATAHPGNSAPAAPSTSATLVAQNVAFVQHQLTVLDGAGFTIHFDNKDSTTHNVGIYNKKGGKELFKGSVITGPNSTDYNVKGLKPGTYYYQCDIHPLSMTGTLTVK